MPKAEPQASGRAVLGLLRFATDVGGEDAREAVVAAARGATAAALEERVRQLRWYPYEVFVGLLRALDETLGEGSPDFLRQAGQAGGRRDLGTFLKIYTTLASAERLIKSCRRVWPTYYRNAGHMEAVAWEPSHTVVRIYDFPEMDPAHCLLMDGWMRATMESLGFRIEPGARETRCMSEGAPFHEYTCSWTR